MKDKFYVIGVRKKDMPACHYRNYAETKWTLGSALRKAQRYLNKRNCQSVYVLHDKSCNIIYHKERNVEDGEC